MKRKQPTVSAGASVDLKYLAPVHGVKTHMRRRCLASGQIIDRGSCRDLCRAILNPVNKELCISVEDHSGPPNRGKVANVKSLDTTRQARFAKDFCAVGIKGPP